jgi:hypothetical protein
MHKKRLPRLYPDNLAVRKLISPLESSLIPNRQRRANVHGPLRGRCFLRCLGLFKKMNGSLIAVIRQKVRRFFKTETAQRAARIHVPLSRRVLRLSAQFVCHNLSTVRIATQKISSDLLGNDGSWPEVQGSLTFAATVFS